MNHVDNVNDANNDDNNNNENEEEEDTTMRSSIVDTVLIGNNSQFHALCHDLRENRPNLVRANVCIPMLESDEHLTEFATCMSQNHTVQSLTMIIPEDFCMEADDARRLGEMMASQASIRNLVLSNFSARTSALDVFWQGVAQSPSMSVLAVHGVHVSQTGIPQTKHIPSLQGLILDKCTFDTEGSEAFMGLLEQQDSPVVMVRIDSCIMDADVKLRIAKCLAERSNLPAFSFDDASLDGPCADAFAEAIAKNCSLRHVEFHSCSDRTLTVLTKAIAGNTNIMSAKVTSRKRSKADTTNSNESTALAATCQQRIDHYTTLNRAGRKYLREDVARPNAESIEACWFRILLEHQQEEDCSVVFCLLRDYPTIFLRLALGLSYWNSATTPSSAQKESCSGCLTTKRSIPEVEDLSDHKQPASAVKKAKCNC